MRAGWGWGAGDSVSLGVVDISGADPEHFDLQPISASASNSLFPSWAPAPVDTPSVEAS